MPPKATATQVVLVPINGYSDGDISHRPAQPPYAPCDSALYLEKLAKKWMEDSGLAQPGKSYILDRLPAGYVLFDRTRSSGARDKYLFGHPGHQYFDSPNRFYPHFRYLMNHGQGDTCKCDPCTISATSIPRPAAAPAQVGRPNKGKLHQVFLGFQDKHSSPEMSSANCFGSKGKGKMKEVDIGPVDEEGAPDIYATFMQELLRLGSLDVTITETRSMDWRAERTVLPEMIDKTLNQHSFIPRVGELVLWCRDMDGELKYDPRKQEFKLFDPVTKQYTGFPQWMCGTIAQIPNEEILLEDVVRDTEKQTAINTSGFRVECLPDPNEEEKGLSKQYSYVRLRQIRPFHFWQEILQGIPEDDWHPSIEYGLTVMASVCIVSPFRFKGTWPSCNVSCKGMFLGAELFFVGDTVRLVPERSDATLTDVLHIRKILIRWANLEAKADDTVDDSRAALGLHLVGRAYTLDMKRSYKGMTLEPDDDSGRYPPGMEGYGRWYYMQAPGLLHDYTYDRVLGRCHEGEATKYWSAEPKPTLNLGLRGTRAARLYSAENDQRLIESGKKWFWGEHRADCLDLGTLNGIEVGNRDPDRDPKFWRETLRVIDGETPHKKVHVKTPEERRASKSNFTPINSQTSLVASALQQTDDSDVSSDEHDITKEGYNGETNDDDTRMPS